MSVRARQLLMAALVLVFCIQTWLVYADPAGRTQPPLSEAAMEGRALWHDYNCQSCHQLYGFGGFLGPDLTNASERLTDARLEAVLTTGAGQMPAFDLAADARGAIATFLAEVHETGIGQLPPVAGFDAPVVLRTAVEAVAAETMPLSRSERMGFEVLLAQKCIGCHLPNPATTHKGTDLTQLLPKLGRDGVIGILSTGIPLKGMPRFDLPQPARTDLLAFLGWLTGNAEAIQSAFREAAPQDAAAGTGGLPWFEYK